MEKSLNLDIPERISELETLLKEVLPKNIIFRLILTRGLEFDGYREYTPQDDALNIDWKASVRANEILVRKYIEEQELKFIFFVDVSENMIFGSAEKLKCEYAAELVAALAHLMLINSEKIGFILYNNKVVKFSHPLMGNKQFEILCHELSDPNNYGGISNLNSVLDKVINTIQRDVALIFLISDFIKMNESYIKNLELLSALYEVIAIIIRDPLDKTLPEIDKEIIIEDPETNEKLLINPKIAKNVYEENAISQLNFVKKTFTDLGIDFLELLTTESSSQKIAEFLTSRIKGGRIIKTQHVG